MQNSENAKNKQTVKKIDKKSNLNYNTVFTVLKLIDSYQGQLNPINLELIKNIWSGTGSLAMSDQTITWSNKIPSHKQ